MSKKKKAAEVADQAQTHAADVAPADDAADGEQASAELPAAEAPPEAEWPAGQAAAPEAVPAFAAGEPQAEPDELRRQLAEQQDRWLRAVAELDNLRKRSRREVADARRFAQADVLRPLLEVLDNFERALQHAGSGGAEDGAAAADNPAVDSFRQGVVLIAQNFRQVLQDCGVRRIEAVGRPFDPSLHEAVGQAPATEEAPASGTVLAEMQAGYTFDDLVLRASRVIVVQ